MSSSLVSTNVSYSYDVLINDINNLKMAFPFLKVGDIGNSVLGKRIPYIQVGNGEKQVFYACSFHANEWICSPLVMKFIEDFCTAYINNSSIFGFDASSIFKNSSLFIVPMVNPDGVDLVTGVLDSNSFAFLEAKSIADDFPNIPFPDGWKANIKGVDLNLQFPARLGKC